MNALYTQPAKIGSGKAVHAGFINEGNAFTACMRNQYMIERGPVTAAEGEVTCKRCLKALAARREDAHAEALRTNADLDAKRDMVDFLADSKDESAIEASLRYQRERADNMAAIIAEAWDEAHAFEAKRAEFAAAAEELKQLDAEASAKLVDLVTNSPVVTVRTLFDVSGRVLHARDFGLRAMCGTRSLLTPSPAPLSAITCEECVNTLDAIVPRAGKLVQVGFSGLVHVASSFDAVLCGQARGGLTNCKGPVTCKRCKARLDREIDQKLEASAPESAELDIQPEAPAAVILLDDGELGSAAAHVTEHWTMAGGQWRHRDGARRYCGVRVTLGTGLHAGPCVDMVERQEREPVRVSRKARRAARREQQATLREQAPKMRAVAQLRRARRNGVPQTARTLLVAAGVPDGIARRYAPAFSRTVEPTAVRSERIRTCTGRSRRVDVKLFSVDRFNQRAATYRPRNAADAVLFEGVAA